MSTSLPHMLVADHTISPASDLRGRVALVTGGGSGIGRAAALSLADAGAAIAICGRRSEPIEATATHARARGTSALARQADITDAGSRERLIRAVEDELGPIDILVSNAAGTTEIASWLEWSEDAWRNEVEVMALSGFAIAQLIAPSMAQRGFGRIVFVGSVFGVLGADPLLYQRPDAPEGVSSVPYHAGKGAVIATARALACVLARQGITVNVVSPGMVATEGVEHLIDAAVRRRLEARTPIGRLGKPQEIAAAITFLASPSAAFITGHDLVVDGGWSAW